MISTPRLGLVIHSLRNVFVHTKFRQINNSRLWYSQVSQSQQKSAGLIVIGDEILKGQVQDINSHFIANVLYDLGIKLKRISVIGDCETDIVKEIQEFSPQFTYVITSGGIGPTHDDITFEAVAKAFGETLIPHPELVQTCSEFYKTNDLQSPAMKLAHVPQSARLIYGYDKITKKRTFFPSVCVNNVYIFPGVPQLMQKLFLGVCDDLFGDGKTKFHLREVYVTTDEASIAHHLNDVVKEFPNVNFGSYPKFFDSFYKVRLTIESEIEDDVMRAHRKLILTIPKDHLIEYDKAPLENAFEKLMKVAHKKKDIFGKEAIDVMEKCLQEYELENICLYFDGKKESTAVLHICYACLKKCIKDTSNICTLYVQKEQDEKMDCYLRDTEVRYNIKIQRLNGNVEPALRSYLSQHPDIKALIVGSTRDVNPVEGLSEESGVKLIQPLATWADSSLWDFIYSLYLPHFR